MHKAVWFAIFFVIISTVAIFSIVIAETVTQVPDICTCFDPAHMPTYKICLPKFGWSGSTVINAQAYMAVTLFYLQN